MLAKPPALYTMPLTQFQMAPAKTYISVNDPPTGSASAAAAASDSAAATVANKWNERSFEFSAEEIGTFVAVLRFSKNGAGVPSGPVKAGVQNSLQTYESVARRALELAVSKGSAETLARLNSSSLTALPVVGGGLGGVEAQQAAQIVQLTNELLAAQTQLRESRNTAAMNRSQTNALRLQVADLNKQLAEQNGNGGDGAAAASATAAANDVQIKSLEQQLLGSMQQVKSLEQQLAQVRAAAAEAARTADQQRAQAQAQAQAKAAATPQSSKVVEDLQKKVTMLENNYNTARLDRTKAERDAKRAVEEVEKRVADEKAELVAQLESAKAEVAGLRRMASNLSAQNAQQQAAAGTARAEATQLARRLADAEALVAKLTKSVNFFAALGASTTSGLKKEHEAELVELQKSVELEREKAELERAKAERKTERILGAIQNAVRDAAESDDESGDVFDDDDDEESSEISMILSLPPPAAPAVPARAPAGKVPRQAYVDKANEQYLAQAAAAAAATAAASAAAADVVEQQQQPQEAQQSIFDDMPQIDDNGFSDAEIAKMAAARTDYCKTPDVFRGGSAAPSVVASTATTPRARRGSALNNDNGEFNILLSNSEDESVDTQTSDAEAAALAVDLTTPPATPKRAKKAKAKTPSAPRKKAQAKSRSKTPSRSAPAKKRSHDDDNDNDDNDNDVVIDPDADVDDKVCCVCACV